MPPNLRNARTVPAFLLTMIFLTGCASLDRARSPVARQLPPESSVVLDPAPKPRIAPGDDARVAWKKEEARANDNEARLVKSRKIYRGVRKNFGASK
jgi:hypothetical protein